MNYNIRIGSFVKQSLSDWKGKVAAVVFTKGCNFRCGYCHNPSLVLPELINKTPDIPIGEVLDYLKERKGWLDGVVVTGGEPTIHANLPDFLNDIRKLGYRVKLDTNGSHPEMLESIVNQGIVDYVAMDVKALLSAGTYAKITGIANANEIIQNVLKSISLLNSAMLEVEFRTTRIPKIHTDEIIALTRIVIGNKKLYTINEYRAGETVNSYQNKITHEQL